VGGSIWEGVLLDWVFFFFILNLCIFLEMLRCQLVNGGQKTSPLCHDRIVAAIIYLRYISKTFAVSNRLILNDTNFK
jgi:hypothetical protein